MEELQPEAAYFTDVVAPVVAPEAAASS